MQINDILYTPLDVGEKPEFDIKKLQTWISENYEPLSAYRNIISEKNTAENKIENYPWNLTVAYFNKSNKGPGWLGNFDIEFPELSRHIYESFGLSIDDLGLVLFLPVKQGHSGMGFWHSDPDWYGLRHYFDFESPETNKLLIRQTKTGYTERPALLNTPVSENLLQSDITECKLLSTKQSFFLNNVRSVHSIYTGTPHVSRIAAIVIGKDLAGLGIKEKIEPLVIRSAEKYKDYAVLWDAEK